MSDDDKLQQYIEALERERDRMQSLLDMQRRQLEEFGAVIAAARNLRLRACELLATIPLGELWCDECKSFDRTCKCSPSVTERTRKQFMSSLPAFEENKH